MSAHYKSNKIIIVEPTTIGKLWKYLEGFEFENAIFFHYKPILLLFIIEQQDTNFP